VRFASVLAAALVLAAGLVALSRIGTHDASRAPADTSVEAADLFAGVPQRGAVLGDPAAPVTLVEYADLQCPYCADWAIHTLPVLVSDYVRPGRLRIVFRGLAFIGADSETALRTAVAAGHRQRLWNVVHGLYVRQGPENSGWASEAVLADVAAGIPGLDASRLRDERYRPWVDRELERHAAAARAARVSGTPAFQIGRTGGPLRSVELRSLDPEGLRPAIDAILAR
jgi:protein-disulfide isomerase